MPTDSPVNYLCQSAEDLHRDIVRLGRYDYGGSWIACEGNRRYPKVVLSVLHVGACVLNLMGIVSFLIGSAITSLPAVKPTLHQP